MVFTRIMCAVDFSAGARKALRVAAALARESSTPLVLAHVWHPAEWAVAGEPPLSPSAIEGMVEAEQTQLTRWMALARELGAREVSTRFLTGLPWDQIVTLARHDRTIDLIVMGTHGRTGLSHVLLGSVAEEVARHAPCAVMVVRPTEDKA